MAPPPSHAVASRRRRRQPLATVFTPPAVIVGGKANAVSVARSLRRAGVKVYAIGDETSPVRHSRACAVFADLGRDGETQGRWLDWLLTTGPRNAVVLPCNDDGLEMICNHRSLLTAHGLVPFEANDDVALAMLDKARTYTLARSIGVDSPRTLTVRTVADVDRVAAEIGYPCALKPLHSHVFQRHAGARIKAFVVQNAAELRARFSEMHALGVQMLATEIIQGPDSEIFGYYTYIAPNGEPLFHLTKRKIRQYPVGFGTGSYHVTCWEPDVVEAGLAFVEGVGIRGLANVELKRDARDGRLKLIECNHRFTAPTELLRRAGLDVSVFVYDRLRGVTHRRVRGYRTGVRLYHPVEDLRAFLHMRGAGELTLRAWLASIARPQHMAVFSWTDPRPSVAEHMRRTVQLWDRSHGADAAGAGATEVGEMVDLEVEQERAA
jgi:D-aspartate ligase